MKKSKTQGIPISALCASELKDNDRNFDILLESIIHDESAERALMCELLREGKYDADGVLLPHPELTRLRNKLNWDRKLRDAIKEEKMRLQNDGAKHLGEQLRKAGRPRPKKNEDKITLDDVIKDLVNGYPVDTKPSELWPHFKNKLEDWSDGVVEESPASGKIADSSRYSYSNFKSGGKDAITYGSFRKKVSEARKHNSGN